MMLVTPCTAALSKVSIDSLRCMKPSAWRFPDGETACKHRERLGCSGLHRRLCNSSRRIALSCGQARFSESMARGTYSQSRGSLPVASISGDVHSASVQTQRQYVDYGCLHEGHLPPMMPERRCLTAACQGESLMTKSRQEEVTSRRQY